MLPAAGFSSCISLAVLFPTAPLIGWRCSAVTRCCTMCLCAPRVPPCSWVQLLEKEGIIEKFVPIDFTDVDTVFDRCLKVWVCQGCGEDVSHGGVGTGRGFASSPQHPCARTCLGQLLPKGACRIVVLHLEGLAMQYGQAQGSLTRKATSAPVPYPPCPASPSRAHGRLARRREPRFRFHSCPACVSLTPLPHPEESFKGLCLNAQRGGLKLKAARLLALFD